MANGVRIGSGCADTTVNGIVNNATNRVVGTWGAGSFVRINGNGSLVAVG